MLPIAAIGKEGKELFSVEIETFTELKAAKNLLSKLPPNEKFFICEEQHVYSVREGIFDDIKKAKQEKDRLKNRYNLKGRVVEIHPKSLLYLVKNEDYEELLGLLSEINPENLPPSLLPPVGTSLLKTGNIKKAVKILELALKKGEKDAIIPLTQAYYALNEYKNIIRLYQTHTEAFPERALYYVARSYIALKKPGKVRKLLSSIKDSRLRKKILNKRKSLNLSVALGYDSNLYLIPENIPLQKRNRDSWYRKFLLGLSGSSVLGSQSLSIFGKWLESRNNKELDFLMVSFRKSVNISDYYLIVPSLSYVYTLNQNYSVSIKSGLGKNFDGGNLVLLCGFERNFISDSRNNTFLESYLNYGSAYIYLLLRNYKSINNKLYAVAGKKFRFEISQYFGITVSPYLKYTSYSGSTKSYRPGISGEIYTRIKGGKLFLRSGYEKNFAHDENIEWDYTKHFIEFGYKFSF